jgi:hypothetical protein
MHFTCAGPGSHSDRTLAAQLQCSGQARCSVRDPRRFCLSIVAPLLQIHEQPSVNQQLSASDIGAQVATQKHCWPSQIVRHTRPT